MSATNIAKYLDSGSITLFAKQIIEVLGNVSSVAIHDSDGQLAWAGPDKEAGDQWAVAPLPRERLPGPGFCERLSNRNFAYVFYLHGEDADALIGTVSIQINPANPISFEFAHAEIDPILRCIERQLAINAELSSVRRMTYEGKKGLQLLMQMDELDGSAGPQEILQTVLNLSAQHFAADLVAIVLPKLGIEEIWPAQLIETEAARKSVRTTIGALVAAAKTHRKVLLSDTNISAQLVAGMGKQQPKILCTPILNVRDEVIGIFALLGKSHFSSEQVRLSRAIAAKIRTLTRMADQLSAEHYSRHGLLQFISNVLHREASQSHALLYIDADKLHVVNDNYGHLAGDAVIRRVSVAVDEVANKGDAVSHLSGDRFGLFIRGGDEACATEKAKLILEALAHETVSYEGADIEVSASIGIVVIPDVAANASAALNTAEIAARSAKSRGGNRAVVYRDLDASVAQRRTDLDQVNQLQYALIRNRLVLYAQPIVSLKDADAPSHFEILVRMLDDNDKAMPPSRFLSSAERYQMMSAIDRWVIKNTLDQLSAADNMLEVNLARFSINVSAQSLADDEFSEFIEKQIVESGIAPDALCFEITETVVVRNLERAQRFIRRLRKLGCRVALDDFGTGYCSFAYLKDLPVHYVKIDGVFVRDVLENPLSVAIIRSMTEIAKVMNAQIVAEHVENDLIAQSMRNYDIDLVQGFVFGKPMPLEEVLRKLGPPIMLDDTMQSVDRSGIFPTPA